MRTHTIKGGRLAKATSPLSSIVRLESKESLAFKDYPKKGSLHTKLLNTTDSARV